MRSGASAARPHPRIPALAPTSTRTPRTPQHGRVVLISTYMSLVSMATGVFMGMVVLDEAIPSRFPPDSLLIPS